MLEEKGRVFGQLKRFSFVFKIICRLRQTANLIAKRTQKKLESNPGIFKDCRAFLYKERNYKKEFNAIFKGNVR